MRMDAEVTIESGELVAQRVFDVAYAIDLGRADQCWKDRGFVAGTRARLSNAPPKALAFDVAPLLVELDAVTLGLDDGDHVARVTARLYDFGVIARSPIGRVITGVSAHSGDSPWTARAGVGLDEGVRIPGEERTC
jgi:hypothetical protein